MKRKITLLSLVVILLTLKAFTQGPLGQSAPMTQQYVLVAWNDLGMHCANLDFSNMCILPPYNTQKAQVILKGSPSALPVVLSGPASVSLTYEIPGNTESASKTNFWSYAQQLFGVPMAPNTGLTGSGMTGVMAPHPTENYYMAEGIPVTAFPDATPTVPAPFQLTLIKAYGPTGEFLTSTQSVIPVSHEINCVSSGCHASELAILQKHDQVPGFNINNRPIFCATCHSDNALGMPGQPGVPPFSQAIHEKHGGFINSGTSADCYKCHPGPNTQCWRDVMHGSTGGITKCQDCHGSVSEVGHSIDSGRQPWLQEPSCGATSCHGPNYAEEPGKLFRNSRGHGGLFCSACHGSPHAIFPTGEPNDNVQNVSLQGFSGTLSDCSVCHGYTPSGPGPHGIHNTNVQNSTVGTGQSTCNSTTGLVTVAGGGTGVDVQPGGSATFIAGYKVRLMPGTTAEPGGYLHGYITVNGQYCATPASPLATRYDSRESASFRVFPNPTTGDITVEAEKPRSCEGFGVEIYGTAGSLIHTGSAHGTDPFRCSLSGHPAGVYLVRIITDNGTLSKKVVLQ